jgi:hypothetical protein
VSSPAPFPFGGTAKINRGVRDVRHGDITYTYHHSIDGCALAPRYSNEASGENRGSVIVGFTLFGPSQVGDRRVFADDEVEWVDGNKYRVVGEAADWDHPMTGWKPGFEAALERVT